MFRSKKWYVALLVLTSIVAVTFVAAMPPAPTPQARPKAVTDPSPVKIVDFSYMPTEVDLPASGGSVNWINTGGTWHSATSDDDGKSFDSKRLEPGQSFKQDFAPGNYTITYHCLHHSGMTGKVVVGTGAEKRTKPAAKKPAVKGAHGTGK